MSVVQMYEHLTTFNLYENFYRKLTGFHLDFHEAFPVTQNKINSKGIKIFPVKSPVCLAVIS